MPAGDPPIKLDQETLALHLGVTPRTIRRWAETGLIAPRWIELDGKAGAPRKLYDLAEVEDQLRRHRTGHWEGWHP